MSGEGIEARLVGMLLILLAAFGACSRFRHEPSFKMRPVDGGMGLALEVPEGLDVSRNGAALNVHTPSSKLKTMRSGVWMTLTIVDKQPDVPDARTRTAGGRTIHYVVTTLEGAGSGGDEVRLRAWVESNGRFVLLDSANQPDSGGDEEFRAEWAILPTLRWQAPALR